MSVLLRRTYLKVKNNVLHSTTGNGALISFCFTARNIRAFSEDKTQHEFINSTILMENGLNMQELPVIVRKLKNISEIETKPQSEDSLTSPDSMKYHLIQTEFRQCVDLRDVFSLLSKCTKITPDIALGAMERIYDLEKSQAASLLVDSNIHVNMAKGAILDKLVKVVTTTEDTQTILNVLKSVSIFMNPYKYKFCDELLIRVTDNKLTVGQLCEFMIFLISKKNDPKYSEMIDKLWVGFVQKESEVDEDNIVTMFAVVPALKSSKRVILHLLEQKFFDLWTKIKVPAMLEILNSFIEENYSSMQTFAVVGRWFYTNIHALDEDSLLDTITKLTRLNYTDDHVEKAIKKYVKLKGSRIESQILILGILNYCMQFHVIDEHILDVCGEYYLKKGSVISPSFLKSAIYPFGFLYHYPKDSKFWDAVEADLQNRYNKIPVGDMASMILTLIYVGRFPVKLANRILCPENVVKINNPEVQKKFRLIDTALSLECEDYPGPLLPKDQWSKPVSLDGRISNIIEKIRGHLTDISGDKDKVSTGVLIPNLYANDTYLIDIMLHPKGLGSNIYNWKSKTARNENTAILIHLPDHFCSGNSRLVGPQVMKKRHLKLLGFKVVSLKYSILSQFYTSYNTSGLKKYICDSIEKAEVSEEQNDS